MKFPLLASLTFSLSVLVPPAHADIVVAVAGPMSGSYANYGDQMRAGVAAAISAFNARGGVLGERLVMRVEDDSCDPRQAVSVANKLAAASVRVVIGHFCSSATIPAVDVYAPDGILAITPASSNPVLTDQAATRGWRTVLRIIGRDDAQAPVLAGYIGQQTGRIALVSDKSVYADGLVAGIRAALPARAADISVYAVTPGERDFNALVSRLKQERAATVFYGGYHTEAGLLIRQSREQAYAPQFVGADALATKELVGIAGGASDGLVMTFSRDPSGLDTAAAAIRGIKAAGGEPSWLSIYSYTAVTVYADAAAAAGTHSIPAVADALRRPAGFETPIGTVQFDAKGDIKNPAYILFRWKDGGYTPIR